MRHLTPRGVCVLLGLLWISIGIQHVWGAIAEVGVSDSQNTGAATATSLTFALDSGTGADRLIICGGHRRTLNDMTLITYAGTNMIKLTQSEGGGASNTIGVELWYQVPTATDSNNVVATFPSMRAVVGCMTLIGANVGSPFGTPVTFGAAAASSFPVTVPSAVGELVVSVFTRTFETDVPSPDAPQVEEYNMVTTSATSLDNVTGLMSTDAGAASVVMDYSWDATTYAGDHIGVAVLPSTGAVSVRRAPALFYP